MPMGNMRIEAHVHNIPDNRVVETHGEGRIVGVYIAVDLAPLTLLDSGKRGQKGHTGKKFAATLVLTFVNGVLISCGYQNVSLPPPVVIAGYVLLSFLTPPLAHTAGKYFSTL